MSTEVKAKYNFEITKERDYTVVSYRKTPISYKLATSQLAYVMIIPAAILAVLIVVSMRSKNGIFWGFMLFFFFIIALGVVYTFILNYFRTKKIHEFKISDRDIIVGKKTYNREHVHSFFIQRTHVTYHNVQTVHEIIEKSNNKICIRYGSNDVVLAKGLGEKDAEIMFDRIRELTSLQ